MTKAVALVLSLTLAACAASGARTVATAPAGPATGAAVPAGGTAHSNASLARVFGALALGLEWGAERQGLARMELPVAVALSGSGAAGYAPFLDGYLAFLSRGAGIDIARRGEGASALHLRFVDGVSFARALPAAACVVVPGNLGWGEFRRDPVALGSLAMTRGGPIRETTIFLPGTAPPHQIRGCLMEEIPQALGLANDLYGLADSVFNDDAAHLWPTRLDLLMLRTLYQPEIRPGMTRADAETAARTALDRINPAGRSAQPLRLVEDRDLGEWRQVAGRVHDGRTDPRRREDQARAASNIAAKRAPGSLQDCQSRSVLARVVAANRPAAGAAALADARKFCAGILGPNDIRLARLRLEEGRALMRAGHPRAALIVTEGLEAPFAALDQPDRLATLFALRARALRAIQRETEAADARRLAAAWGAHAFGADDAALDRWLSQ